MLTKHLLHRSGRALLHVREHMRVGIEGNGYAGVSEHLGHYLWVDVLGEKQRGTSMPKVVKAYVGQLRSL
jgi:hypothetical protein